MAEHGIDKRKHDAALRVAYAVTAHLAGRYAGGVGGDDLLPIGEAVYAIARAALDRLEVSAGPVSQAAG